MSTDLTTPTRQSLAVKDRSAKGKVTGKLKHALDLMVWKGSRRTEAAEGAGLKDHSVREALRKPHVKAYYLEQLDVLRTSERARNIHALVRVRDSDRNAMATVAAAKSLEQLGDGEEMLLHRAQSLGFVVHIMSSSEPRIAGPVISVTPARQELEPADE